jgi:glycerate 2-kinase
MSLNTSRRLPESKFSRDALAIWQAGVDAVRADQVIEHHLFASRYTLATDEHEWEIDPRGRLIIVGAGKAAFMMTKAFLRVAQGFDSKIEQLGWVNVPEGTAIEPLDPRVVVSEARPVAINEPTPKVLEGTQRIIDLVNSATPHDTVICLLSGGGSALLSSPIEGVSLQDKLDVIRTLSHGGANIEQLNCVRRGLSKVKGGGLVRHCRAKQWITFIISDVLGDPLEAIASGPTVAHLKNDYQKIQSILAEFDPGQKLISKSIYDGLADRKNRQMDSSAKQNSVRPQNIILANNATAIDAAGVEAVRLGYAYWMSSSPTSEGSAESLGRELAKQTLGLVDQPKIQCIITGGEPTVSLPPSEQCGRGGRNQQLVLAALDELIRQNVSEEILRRFALLSGGTDGEDGPTDAAGAWIDQKVLLDARSAQLDGGDYLKRCDAYRFFEQTNSLILTGPTHTNVGDIRVAILGA